MIAFPTHTGEPGPYGHHRHHSDHMGVLINMGLFKQMKDLKNVVAAAPDMMAQAQQTSAAAQAYAAQQQAAYGATGYTAANAFGAPVATGIAADDPRLTPIAGVG